MREDCGPHNQSLGSGVTVYHLVENLEKVKLAYLRLKSS